MGCRSSSHRIRASRPGGKPYAGVPLPPTWQWQRTLTKRGLTRADAVMAPTASHGDALIEVYGPIEKLHVVPNATAMARPTNADEPIVFAAGRWWDEGKNARHTRRSRRTVALAGDHGGCDQWP